MIEERVFGLMQVPQHIGITCKQQSSQLVSFLIKIRIIVRKQMDIAGPWQAQQALEYCAKVKSISQIRQSAKARKLVSLVQRERWTKTYCLTMLGLIHTLYAIPIKGSSNLATLVPFFEKKQGDTSILQRQRLSNLFHLPLSIDEDQYDCQIINSHLESQLFLQRLRNGRIIACFILKRVITTANGPIDQKIVFLFSNDNIIRQLGIQKLKVRNFGHSPDIIKRAYTEVSVLATKLNYAISQVSNHKNG